MSNNKKQDYYYRQRKPISCQASSLVQYSLILLIFLGFILVDLQEQKDKICLSVICFSCTSLNWLCINQHNADISSPLPLMCTWISNKDKKKKKKTVTEQLKKYIYIYLFFVLFLDTLDDTDFQVIQIHLKSSFLVNVGYSCLDMTVV